MSDDINDFLFGSSGKAAKFENLGDMVVGVILDAKKTQQTSMEDNTPLTWQDGSPRMQLVVSLQTDQRDDDDDDGVRRVFAKGGTYEVAEGAGTSMKAAIADAVKRAGTKFEDGGKLTVAYTGNGKKTNRGYTAPKLFKAKYEPPSKVAITDDDLFAED
jgi:hypothetical protein